MVPSRRLLFFGVFLALFLCAPLAHAQQDASIIGTVTDETKAVLPGATVTATNLETGNQYSGVADANGQYRLLRLLPGKYKVQAELQGFATIVVPSVELLVGQNATVPFALKVASVSETLTITAESPLVDVSSSQVAGNVDRRQMEQMPLQGRNWMELSKLVKGITANDVTNTPGVSADDMFQLNLDGQQITQKIAGSGFGQPSSAAKPSPNSRSSRTCSTSPRGGRRASRCRRSRNPGRTPIRAASTASSGTTSLNAPDTVAKTVLPYSNQQLGGTFGGPIIKDKLHYFASYEYEREPGTIVSSPSTLPGQSFTVPYKNGQKSLLARVDDQMRRTESAVDPRIALGRGAIRSSSALDGHPSNASVQTKAATNILGSWSHISAAATRSRKSARVTTTSTGPTLPQPSMVGTPEYDFPGLTIGAPYNYPQHPPAEQLREPLRSELAQEHARPQDRRRVHLRASTPATGTSRRSGATR